MTPTAKLFWTYMDDDSAATAIEYGLIAGVISIAAVMVLMQIGTSINLMFERASKF